MEVFGLIRVKLRTAYTRAVRCYFRPDCDIIGIYYTNENQLQLILYDVYTSERIHGVSFLGELLLWESVEEISTRKFYCCVDSSSIFNEIITSFLLYTPTDKEISFRNIVLQRDYKPEIYGLISAKLESFVITESAESIYRQTTAGVTSEVLQEVYDKLHDSFFATLCKLNKEGYSVFTQEASHAVSIEQELIRKLRRHFQDRQNGILVPLELRKTDINLGKNSFMMPIIVNYSGDPEEKKLHIVCQNYDVLLSAQDTDLSFLHKKTLTELLSYIELSNESFFGLERKIVAELNRRTAL